MSISPEVVVVAAGDGVDGAVDGVVQKGDDRGHDPWGVEGNRGHRWTFKHCYEMEIKFNPTAAIKQLLPS